MPTVTVEHFSSQKPWVNRTVRVAENTRIAGYKKGLKSGDMTVYKVASNTGSTCRHTSAMVGAFLSDFCAPALTTCLVSSRTF